VLDSELGIEVDMLEEVVEGVDSVQVMCLVVIGGGAKECLKAPHRMLEAEDGEGRTEGSVQGKTGYTRSLDTRETKVLLFQA